MASATERPTVSLPCCGLANRLRVVFSAAMHSHRPTIVWAPSPISGALFSDLFEPHPAFHVLDDRRWRSDDFGPRCQEAATCIRWRPISPQQERNRRRLGQQERKKERKNAESESTSMRTCASIGAQLGYDDLFAAAGMRGSGAFDAAAIGWPAVYRGCGMRFSDAEVDPRRCVRLARSLRPLAWLRRLVSQLLPSDPRCVVGVHLRAPDNEMDIGGVGVATTNRSVSPPSGRRLSQGSSKCHPISLYVRMVGDAILADARITHVYVAAGALAHIQTFRRELLSRLHLARGDRGLTPAPTILTLTDLLALDGAPIIRPRPAFEGPYAGGGRDTVYGVQGALLELWALASTSIIFRTGESTFGMLAAALHRAPTEVLVHDTSVAGCRTWSQMYPGANGSWPAFCAPNRGLEAPKTCACTT